MSDRRPHVGRRHRLASILISLGVLATFAPTAEALAPTNLEALAPANLPVELYYLKLLNCTRTGGTVLADGKCSGYGSGRNGGYRTPYVLVTKVSDQVSRPYSKLLVDRVLCNHFYDHDPLYRLRRAGITVHRYGENVGCHDNRSPYASVLASELVFQGEKPYGGHWLNIKDARLKYVGIGLWQVGTRIRFTVDFYSPFYS